MRKITLAALLLLAPAVSQAKTLEELLVEKGVITKGEAQSASQGSAAKVTYTNKGTRFDWGPEGVTTGFNVLLQERYTYDDVDNDSGESNRSSFSVEKARIYVWGTVLNEEFEYLLNGDFVGTSDSSGKDAAALRDAFLKWNACDWGWVRTGQFKTGLSRQFNNSDYKLQFADRSIASDYFSLDRQRGLDGSVELMDGMVTVGAGIFNGDSDGEGINQDGKDTHHTGVVNVRVNPLGKMDAFTEGDIDGTEDLALSFGAAYANSSAKADVYGTGTQDFDRNSISVDGNLKVAGFSLHAEFFNEVADTDTEDDYEPSGFYAQAGYFVLPKEVEIAAGYSLLDCDNGGSNVIDTGLNSNVSCVGLDQINEVKVGANYYWKGHNLKAQLNYVHTNEDGVDESDTDDNKWLLQLTQYL